MGEQAVVETKLRLQGVIGGLVLCLLILPLFIRDEYRTDDGSCHRLTAILAKAVLLSLNIWAILSLSITVWVMLALLQAGWFKLVYWVGDVLFSDFRDEFQTSSQKSAFD